MRRPALHADGWVHLMDLPRCQSVSTRFRRNNTVTRREICLQGYGRLLHASIDDSLVSITRQSRRRKCANNRALRHNRAQLRGWALLAPPAKLVNGRGGFGGQPLILWESVSMDVLFKFSLCNR